MMSKLPALDSKLSDLNYTIFSTIANEVELRSCLKSLIAFGDGTRYQLSEMERFKILQLAETGHDPNRASAGEALLRIWSGRSMTVHELAAGLHSMRLEKPLMLLITPVPLALEENLPERVELNEAQTLYIKCEASGIPYAHYTFFKHTSDRVIAMNRTGILEIQNVGLNDTGCYICRIHNSLKQELLWTDWCEVFVKELPSVTPSPKLVNRSADEVPKIPHFIEQPPKELTVKQGGPLILSLKALGALQLKYWWTKDGNILTKTPQDHPTFCIESCRFADKGEYKCSVSNTHGETCSRSCQVKIIIDNGSDQPVIRKQPTTKQEAIGGWALFFVEAECPGMIQYQWYHNNNVLHGECSSELRIAVDYNKEGTYQCRLTNTSVEGDLSILTDQAHLTVTKARSTVHTATDKLALILGQSNYRSNFKPLPGVKNDVYLTYQLFNKLNFKTLSFLDLTLEEMNNSVEMACSLMDGKGNDKLYVVVYIIGHGFLHENKHYLMPSDAPEGPELSKCLCIEEVEEKFASRLNPELFVMFPDVCRNEYKSILGKGPTLDGEPCKKRVIFFATSIGDESTEEKTETPRGMFNRGLLETLSEGGEQLKLVDLYRNFTKKFQRPDQEQTGKRQNPELLINLEDCDRSLGDPIINPGYEQEYEERLDRWSKLNVLRTSSQSVQLTDGWFINVKYIPLSSNVLEIQLSEVDLGAGADGMYRGVDFSLKIIKPQSLCHIDDCTTEHKIEHGKSLPSSNIKVYRTFNLQRLTCALVLELEMNLKNPRTRQPESSRCHLDLDFPLVSAMWFHKWVRPSGGNIGRQACEHSEPDHSESELSSLERSLESCTLKQND